MNVDILNLYKTAIECKRILRLSLEDYTIFRVEPHQIWFDQLLGDHYCYGLIYDLTDEPFWKMFPIKERET